MPNWVYNHGTIMCSNSNTAEKFFYVAKAGELLNFIKPIPSGYCSYSWGIENWASKWDVSFCHGSLNNEIVELAFQTPWSPPFKAFETLFDRDDVISVEMKFDSLEMGFYGSWINGESIRHEDDLGDFSDESDQDVPF
jgi:hypothetical protein